VLAIGLDNVTDPTTKIDCCDKAVCEQCRPVTLTRRDTLRLFGMAAAVLPLWWEWRQRSERVDPIDVAPGLSILPRQAWAGDLAPRGPMGTEDVKFLLVHHTASPNNYTMSGAIDVMRSAYRLHTGPAKGWPDVCYNFFVDRFGRVWEGRAGSLDGPVVADATGGSQGFAQLVCLLGDFTSEMPSPQAIDALTRTLAWMADRFALTTTPNATDDFVSRGSNLWPPGSTVTAAIISGHRDMSSTACPGDTFYPYVHTQLQGEVDALRQRGAATPTTEATTTTTSSTTTTPVPTSVPPTNAASTSSTSSTPASVTSSIGPGSTAPPGTSVATTAASPTPDPSKDHQWAIGAVGLGGAAVVVGAGVGVGLSRRHRRDGDATKDPQP
jgi:N-acetylmuramoyl-L-alanine amidase